MNILKALHAGILQTCYSFHGEHFFAVSLLWGFRLNSGRPVLEQELWEKIGGVFGKNEIFDSGMPKATGEVLIHGSFFAPDRQPVKAGQVSLTIGSVHKDLSVFGDRRWRKTPVGAAIEGPEPFTEMPITYYQAFGGEGYAQNPVGKGIGAVDTESGPVYSLPNIEYPEQLIFSPRDRPDPAAFSRLDPMWRQRFSKSGTYDKKYIKERMPGLPDDINWTFFNEASPDQWIEEFFRGDEKFEIINMNPDMPVQEGRLPGVYGRCFVNHGVDDEIIFKEIPTRLDTVWFFPSENLGVLIHRGTLEISEDDGGDVKQLLIAHENLQDPPRSEAHYLREITERSDPETAGFRIMNTAPLLPDGCKCGFKIMEEESEKPLENLTNRNLGVFTDKKVEESKEKLEEQLKERRKNLDEGLRAEGVDPEPYMKKMEYPKPGTSPEEEEINALLEAAIPGIVSDPKKIDFSRIDIKKLKDIEGYSKRLTEKKQKEAEDQLNQELDRLKSLSKENPEIPEIDDTIDRIESALAETKKPPLLPRLNIQEQMKAARDQYAQAQQQALVLHSMGIPSENLDDLDKLDIDFDELEPKVMAAVKTAMDGYRLGAHSIPESRSPHEGKEPEIAAAVVKAYQDGGKTAGGDYAFTDLSGLDLSGIDLSGAYLEYVNLTDANLTDADLSNAILAHADLTRTDFTRAKLTGANVGAATMKNTRFVDADLTGAILGKAKIEEAVFHRCKLVDRMEMFLDTSFQKVDFSGSDLKKNNFIDSDISGCIFAGADLSESNFINPKMDNTDFNGSILKSVNFIKAEAENAVFRQAEMKNARFVGGCILPGADFSGADAGEANLRDCELQNADFTDAFLHKADFGGSDLTRAKFVRANAVQAQFNKSNLVYADLYRIHLMEGSLYKARLSAARFTEANLYSVNFMGSIVGEEGMDDADFTDAYR